MIAPQDLDRLIHDYLDGQLDEAGFQQLNLLIKTDPRVALRLAEWATDREALLEVLSLPEKPAVTSEKAPTEPVAPITAHAATSRKKISSKKRTPVKLRLVQPGEKTEPAKFDQTAWYAMLVAACIWMVVGVTWLVLNSRTKTATQPLVASLSESEKGERARREALRTQQADRIRQQEEWVRLDNERQKRLQQVNELELQKSRLAQESPERNSEEARAKLQEQLDRERNLLAEIDALATAARKKEKATTLEIARAKERAEGIEPDFREVASKAVGRVVYLKPPENKDILLPVLVRPLEQGRQTRMPVEHGMTIKAGDRIETTQGLGGENATARAALELSSGATMDVADNTAIEFISRDFAKLDHGQIYANFSVDRHTVDTGAEDDHLYGLTIQTPAGTLSAASARCEIDVHADEVGKTQTRVRVETGNVSFTNEKGRCDLNRNQELLAKPGLALGAPEPIRGALWRGRKLLANLTDGRLPFDQTCPVIWTNDNPGVWFAEDYLVALAQGGEIDCRGLVASLTDVRGSPYYTAEKRWFETLERQLPKVPPAFVLGCLKPLVKPASGQYRDTRPEDSEGMKLILAEARKASPARPLVVLTAGGVTDVASAWLADPAIAKNIVVLMRSVDPNNIDFRFDPWAAQLVLDNVNCVIPQGGSVGKIEPERFDKFPDSVIREALKEHAQKATSDVECGLAVAFFHAGSLQNVRRVSLALQVQNGSFFFKDDVNGNIWTTSGLNEANMQAEFWRAMQAPGFLIPKK